MSLIKDPECHLVDELHPHFLEKSVSQKDKSINEQFLKVLGLGC